jgi:hypothetical protein
MSARTYPDPADLRHARCIVLGCPERPIACCYTRHGRSAYCPSHNPERLGMAHPYLFTVAPVQASAAPHRKPDVGPQPPVRPITPPKAPTPAPAFEF